MKQEKFNFRFLNLIMYIGGAIVLFYVLKNLGIVQKTKEILVALIPVFIGILVCMLSIPLANVFKKRGMNKKLSAVLSLIIIFGILIAFFSFFIPVLIKEISHFIVDLPNIYSSALSKINSFLNSRFGMEPIEVKLNINALDLVKNNIDNIINYSITTIQSVTNIIISIFTIIVISFFMVNDMDKFKATILKIFTKNNKESKIYKIIVESETMLISYVKGMLIDSLIVGVLVTIACFLLKIKYAVIFGALITVLNLIPYIGALISELIIALFALSTGGIWYAIFTFAIMVLIQLIDANILQPNIVAKSVKLHPVTVFTGLIVFNLIMGMFGMLIAVPSIAIIKIIIKYAFDIDGIEIYDVKEKQKKAEIKK